MTVKNKKIDEEITKTTKKEIYRCKRDANMVQFNLMKYIFIMCTNQMPKREENTLLSVAYPVPSTVLRALHTLIFLIFNTTTI